MGSTCKKHDWLVNKLYEHPELVGLPRDDIVAKTQEYALQYKGHLLTIPDILFYDTRAHFIEVKSEGSEFLYNKGMSQLEKICIWHENQGLQEPDAKLVMPNQSRYKHWIDMLHDLKYYELGDDFRSPRTF